MKSPHRHFLLAAVCAAFLGTASAAPDAGIASLAAKEKQMAKQVDLNRALRRISAELTSARERL